MPVPTDAEAYKGAHEKADAAADARDAAALSRTDSTSDGETYREADTSPYLAAREPVPQRGQRWRRE